MRTPKSTGSSWREPSFYALFMAETKQSYRKVGGGGDNEEEERGKGAGEEKREYRA